MTVQEVQARIAVITSRLSPSATPDRAGATSFDAVLASAMTSSPSVTSSSMPASGSRAVQQALTYLGVPYRWGGTDPRTGLDCSGLTQQVFRNLGVTLPRVAADQARVGTPVSDLASARPGDLVFFGSPVDHVGIYAGNGRMVVAPHTGDVVKVQTIEGTPTAIRRVIDGNGTAAGDWSTLFEQTAARYGLPPGLLEAVAQTESGMRPDAVSPAGAQGLMQLMPATARGLGVDPFDPAQAVDGAARLLAGNLSSLGSLPLALAAYNAGGGAVQRYGGMPPYPETQAYVQKVLSAMGATQ